MVSSPGKLIISGEHAVVYGRRALVTSIGRRLYMQLNEDEQSEQREIHVALLDKNETYSIDFSRTKDAYPMEIQAIMFIADYFQFNHRIDLQVRSEIPIGAGLGSSAAFSVCLVGCFYLLRNANFDREKINQLAYEVECLFHGTPSGIDNTISTYGQSLLYSRTSQKHLDFRLSNLAIVDTGIPKSTKRMVDLVRSFVEHNPEQGAEILTEIERCVDRMVEHPHEINQLFQTNQQLLKKLGVSIPAIDQIIEKLSTWNISAKITGAGGGGCLIALTSNYTKDQVLNLLKENSIKSIELVECGVEGLREEQTLLLK